MLTLSVEGKRFSWLPDRLILAWHILNNKNMKHKLLVVLEIIHLQNHLGFLVCFTLRDCSCLLDDVLRFCSQHQVSMSEQWAGRAVCSPFGGVSVYLLCPGLHWGDDIFFLDRLSKHKSRTATPVMCSGFYVPHFSHVLLKPLFPFPPLHSPFAVFHVV